MLYLIVGVSHLLAASRSYIGLPFTDTTIISYSICYVHDSLYHRNSLSFHEHYQLSRTSTRFHSLSVCPITTTINSYQFSFFVNSPFLWNPIPYAILQLKKSTVFRLALRHYLFWFLFVCFFVFVVLCCFCNAVLTNLYVCAGEYVCRRVVLYNPVISTKLIIILIMGHFLNNHKQGRI